MNIAVSTLAAGEDRAVRAIAGKDTRRLLLVAARAAAEDRAFRATAGRGIGSL